MGFRGAAAMLGAALALMLTACSGNDEGTTAATTAEAADPAVLADAAASTKAARSARVATDVVRDPTGGEKRFGGEGAFDHEHGFGADGSSATVTTDLFDFGVAVSAKAPPPGQVAAMIDFTRP